MSTGKSKPMLDVGFTGSRDGMTVHQMDRYYEMIKTTPMRSFHHGCCCGGDQQAFLAMYDLRRTVPVHAWPPLKPDYLSINYNEFSDVVHPAMHYHERDREIVHAVQLLVAAPKEPTDNGRSGTWYTLNYAVAQGVPVLFLFPDGRATYL